MRKSTISTLILILTVAVSGQGAVAQETDKQKVIHIFQAMSEKYQAAPYLSFYISYRYTSEEKPQEVLDSLNGEFTLTGDKYYYRLGNTEFIADKETAITIFKEDQLMMIKRRTDTSQLSSPLSLLNSNWILGDSIGCRLEENGKEQHIVLTFKPGQHAKRIEYFINRASGLATKMVNVVPAKEMYDPSVQSMVEDKPVYAIIETDFSGYRTMAAGSAAPVISRYIRKEGKEFKAQAPYENYKIICGNPDLQ